MGVEQKPQSVLTYADERTDAARAPDSLDRAMVVRLARVIGTCIAIFGAILILFSCAGIASSRGISGEPWILIGVLVAGYVLPGIILGSLVPGIREGSKAAAIWILLVGIWTFCVMGATLAGAVLLMLKRFDADAAIVHSLADLLLMIGVGKLLYHDIRLLTFDGRRGANAMAIVSFWDYFSFKWLDDNDLRRRTIFALTCIRTLTGIVVLTAGAAVVVPSSYHRALPFSRKKPPPPRFVSHDLYDADGLPAIDRKRAIDAFNRDNWISVRDQAELDSLLRHFGAQLLCDVPRPISKKGIDQAMSETTYKPESIRIGDDSWGGVRMGVRFGFGIVDGIVHFDGDNDRAELSRGRLTLNGRSRWALGFIEKRLKEIDAATEGKFTQPQADGILSLYTQDPAQYFLDPVTSVVMLPDGALSIHYLRNREQISGNALGQTERVLWLDPYGGLLDHTDVEYPNVVSKANQRAIDAAQKILLLKLAAGYLAVLAGLITSLTALLAFRRTVANRSAGWPTPMTLSLSVSAISVSSVICLCVIGWTGHIAGLTGEILLTLGFIGVPVICEFIFPRLVSKAARRWEMNAGIRSA